MTPLRLDPTFHCYRCETLASSKTCPHGPSARLQLSGTKVRQLLAAGKPLPKEFTRPEIAEILREHYGHGHAKQPLGKAEQTGFVLWLTGLSGAGKSTLAEALKRELEPELPWRCWTATRSGRTCRRGSASRRRTATRTSAGSAGSRGRWRGTASP